MAALQFTTTGSVDGVTRWRHLSIEKQNGGVDGYLQLEFTAVGETRWRPRILEKQYGDVIERLN